MGMVTLTCIWLSTNRLVVRDRKVRRLRGPFSFLIGSLLVLTCCQGHDAMLPHILHLESVTVAPTSKDPHDCRVVYSFTVPKQLCNMGGTSL